MWLALSPIEQPTVYPQILNSHFFHFSHARRQGAHVALGLFVPSGGAVVEFGDGAGAGAVGVHGFADDDGDDAGFFRPTGFWPEFTSVVGNGQDGQVGVDGQGGAASGEFADLAEGDAGAFGEDQDPDAVLEQFIAFFGDVLEGGLGVVAVDGDRAQHGHGPAEEGHEQQFALEDLAQGLEIGGEKERLPGALMV